MPTMKPSKGQIWQNNKTGALVKVDAISHDSESWGIFRVEYHHITGPDQETCSRIMLGEEYSFENKFTICTCWCCEFSKLVIPEAPPMSLVRQRWVCEHSRQRQVIEERDYTCCGAWKSDFKKVGG